MENPDAIIVGAGLSGLSAARLLSQRGLKVLILEATDRAGGRTHTVKPNDGDPQFGWADLGASYVGPSQEHVLRLCKELGVETYLCSDSYDLVQYSRGRVFRFAGVLPKVRWSNPFVAWDLHNMLRNLESMCWEVPIDRPWDAPRAKEWDQMSLKDYYDKHCWTSDCHEFLLSMSTMDNTADEHEMSLLFYLWYLRQGNGPRSLWGVSGGAQERKLVGGSQQLVEKLTKKLSVSDSLLLSKPVVMIRHGPDDVTVQTKDGSTYSTKHVILATPPITQMKIHFEPALPMMRSCLLQRSPMGLVTKCMIYYSEPFWEIAGFNGYVACADGREVVGLITEDKKPGSKYSGLICFIYQQHMVRLNLMSEKDKQAAICQSVARIFKSNLALKPVHFVNKTWPAEQYVCGGYTCYYPPGVLTLFGTAMRAPIGSRVFLAGTETATHWTGYMDGAIDAGERAGREVLHSRGDLPEKDIWLQEPPVRHRATWWERNFPSIDTVAKFGVVISFLVILGLIAYVVWLLW